MPQEEFTDWLDRYDREPFGTQVNHDNWATLFAYLDVTFTVLMEMRDMWASKKSGRTKAKFNKDNFNRSTTGAMVSHIKRSEIAIPVTVDEQKAIAARFAADRAFMRKHFKMRK